MTSDNRPQPRGRHESSGPKPKPTRDDRPLQARAHASASSGASRRRGRGKGRRGVDESERPLPGVSPEVAKRLKASLDKGDFVIFDIETTGGNPEKNGITEIFAIRYHKGQPGGSYYSLVNPGVSVPPIVRRMTGINNAMLKDAPTAAKVMPEFMEFISDDVLVSHNTIGDMKFLRYFSEKHYKKACDNFFLCTHLLVERLVPEAPDKSLKGLSKFFDLQSGNLHRAEADAYLTLELFKVLVRKLEDRSVRSIEAAIRLQSDLESAARLGWGVKRETVQALPHGPGVYYLYDHERRLLFLSGAGSVSREVGKFERYSQVPRSLLRIVLRAYDIQVRRMPNIYAAMLEECEGLGTSNIQFPPVDWHQRGMTFMYIAESAGVTRLNIGNLTEGVRKAFGPVKDRKAAHEFLDQLAQALGVPFSRQGVQIPQGSDEVISALLEGKYEEYFKKAGRSRFSFKMLWRSAERKKVSDNVKLLKKLTTLKNLPILKSLLEQSGVIIVPDEGTGTWQVHTIVASRPRAVQTIRGDWENRFELAGYGRRILDRIKKEHDAVCATPLTKLDAAKVNATLWWMQTLAQREDGFYLSAEELAERIKKDKV